MTTTQITYYKCPFCRVGNMTHAPYLSTTSVSGCTPCIQVIPSGYNHRCSNCVKSMQLDKPYPIETTTVTTQE